ncbi:MAG: tetratricopeptide repeat protein, partial [Tissierellales bacterium]
MRKQLSKRDRRKNYIILAENSYLNGNKDRAVQFYTKALEFEGDEEETIQILYNIAIIYDEMDEPEKALLTYKKITEVDENQAGAFYGMATMYERLDDKDKALECYFKATEIDPYYDRAYFYIANIYDEKGEDEKAIHYYKKVLSLKPDDYM